MQSTTQRLLSKLQNATRGRGDDMVTLVEKLRGVRYLSTMVIEQLDPDYRSFFTVTTPIALKKAIAMAKPQPKGRVKPIKKKQRK